MIELKIGEPTKTQTYIDSYEVDVQYMHGDADAYSDGGNFYPSTDTEDMKMDLLALHFMQNSPFTDIYDQRKERAAIREFFENHGKSKADADAFMDTYVIGDTTNDSQSNARIEDVKVYYWDNDAVKHDVEVHIDERPL